MPHFSTHVSPLIWSRNSNHVQPPLITNQVQSAQSCTKRKTSAVVHNCSPIAKPSSYKEENQIFAKNVPEIVSKSGYRIQSSPEGFQCNHQSGLPVLNGQSQLSMVSTNDDEKFLQVDENSVDKCFKNDR